MKPVRAAHHPIHSNLLPALFRAMGAAPLNLLPKASSRMMRDIPAEKRAAK